MAENPMNRSPSDDKKETPPKRKRKSRAKANPQKGGRKSQYQTKVLPFLEQIPAWRRDGLTERQVAERLKVGYSTFNEYKLKFPELTEAVKEGKQELIYKLETSLYNVAMGMTLKEERIHETIDIDKDGNEVRHKDIKTVYKQQNPNVVALIFALKNLLSEKWSDNPQVDIETDEGKAMSEALMELAKSKINQRGQLRKALEEARKKG